MAESSADASRNARVNPDEVLDPITEDRILHTESASPTTYAGQPDYFDWAPATRGPPEQRGPRRRSTDPTASPGSPEPSNPDTKRRAKTTYESEPESSKNNGPPPSKSRSTHSWLSWSGFNRSKAAEPPPQISFNRRHSTHDTNYSESFEATEVWDRKAILSLDGGGIRGYSALLIIKNLMEAIGDLEQSYPEDPATSSYHPLHPAPVLATDDEVRRLSEIHVAHATKTSAWLPCHYFDYMAGTSTGGLISIMLGRLRMNIDDCITDYEMLGAKVFAHCRWCHLRALPLWWPREKYNHEILQEVVEEVVDTRIPKIGEFPGGKIFAFDENRCRVVVVSFQEQLTRQAEKPFLFRTYKNLHRSVDPKERLIDRNPGPAHDLPIWQVARATSAAPTYFKEVTIEKQRYLDGGFGANNPSVEIYEEVRRMNNNNNKSIGAIISIGTGKNNEQRIPSRLKSKEKARTLLRAGLGKYLDYINFAKKWATDSEAAHGEMTRRWVNSERNFEYHRFNVEHGLDSMKLDEWKARGRLRLGIGKSLGKMKPKRKDTDGTGIALGNITDSGTSSDTNDTQNRISQPAGPRDHSVEPSPIPSWFQPQNKTLEMIRKRTTEYLASPDIQEAIRKCALFLVKGRRERAKADKQRWERACFGAWYQCIIGNCPRGEKEYHDRYQLEKHLRDKHRDLYHNRDARGKRDLDAAIEKCKIVVH